MKGGAGKRPSVWYVAAGYRLPAGIEAYLLHYATEMWNQGFDTQVIVFQPLPGEKHRYLRALNDRRIPIRSLYGMDAVRTRVLAFLLYLPWMLYTAFFKWTRPRPAWFVNWIRKRCAAARLRRLIRVERPDIIHVKGRIIAEAWPVLPSDRTVYHHALMGTVDSSWTAPEVAAFRVFALRIARVFAPGRGVAETLAREFRLDRRIDAVFTMAPDEVGEAGVRYYDPERSHPEGRPAGRGAAGGLPLKFGILCRFTEQKGISYLLEALRLYRDEFGEVDFTFAGMGELEALIREYARRHGLGRVVVHGVDRPSDALRLMDVFVHPGVDDAMPVSMVEALMCGRPCVGTMVGGVPDLIRDGEEGLLIEPRSERSIFRAMSRFARMRPAEIVGFQKRARRRYEECCTPKRVGAVMAGHYREILGGTG